MPARRTATHAVVLLVLGLLLAACGGDPPKKVDTDGDGKPDTPVAEATTPLPPDPRFEIPKAGQCHRMTASQSRAPVAGAAVVDCSGPHNTVVAYVGMVPEAITAKTPVARRRAEAAKVCEPAYQRVVGGTPAARASSILTWAFFTPSAAQLERGARWVRCDVLARSGRELLPLPARPRPLLRSGLPEPLRVCQTPKAVDISCSRPHRFRVEAVFRPTGNAYPDPTAFTARARDRCKALMGKYGGYWQPPSQAGWAAGDRFIRCLSRTG